MPDFFQTALLVEDEPNLGTALEIALRKLGIAVRRATTLQQASEALQEREPDLLLLDRSLPDGDGITLCRWARGQGMNTPVLMLTAIGETSARIEGLDAGADDYLPKPFSWEELEARIRALSRRRPATTKAHQIWELDQARQRVRGPRGWVDLTALEYKLASKLIQSEGAIVTRDDLLKDVWGFNLLPKTRTVDHFLGRLRKHFETRPESPEHFITVRGSGYRFEA